MEGELVIPVREHLLGFGVGVVVHICGQIENQDAVVSMHGILAICRQATP